MGKDFSKKENQIGCGYCINENECEIHKQKPRVNHAKNGCEMFTHFNDKIEE